MNDLARQIDALLPLVTKPSRYLGNEFHVVRKTPDPALVQWVLCMPEVYEIGMSHWGLKILYDLLNRRSDALAERCYAPWFDMEAQLRKRGLPLFSLETRRPLREFDFVGFSLQYELTYTNILNCLDLGGIPIRAADRRDGDPLVIAGGPCVSNPEPLSDFMDIFLIGDGEEAVPKLTALYPSLRGRPRMEILRELSKVPGLYVPQMYEARYDGDTYLGTFPLHDDVPKRVKRVFIEELEDAPYPEAPIVPLQDIVQNRLTLEVLRGCTQGCRFCQAGYLYRPIRERSVEKVLEIADKGIRASGWDEISLVSLSTADYTQLEPLADVMNARFGSDKVAISLPSLRADSFGVGIADRIKETKKTGFTFAPEAGSERLRLAMNKIIRDDEFFRAAEIAYERGWRMIKMYFMVGLPTETWDDIEGIGRFVDRVHQIGQRYSRVNKVNASVGSFVPKSHTPLQWDGFEDMASLRNKVEWLKRRVSSPSTRLKWHHVEVSHLEAIMSLGDRRAGRVIQRAFELGARFDGWTEHMNHPLWMRALKETGVDPEWFTRKKSFDEPLAWDHIDIGILKKWLVRERKKTDEQIFEIGKSLVADCRHGDCTACGIPGLPNDTKLTPKLEDGQFERLIEKARSLSPRNEQSGITWPVRIRYEKVGPCRFISHLEMMSVITRAFRMARVSLAHSQGHTPHPKVHFGPPLSVGVEGRNEAFDAELLEPWSPAMLVRLNALLPLGLRFLDGRALTAVPGVKRKSLSLESERGRYRLELSDLTPELKSAIAEKIKAFGAMESCIVERSAWTPQGSREIHDWESPSDPFQTSPAAAGDGTNQTQEPGQSDPTEAEATVAAPTSQRSTNPRDRRNQNDRRNRRNHGNNGNRGSNSRPNEPETRMVDLKKAILSMSLTGDVLALDLPLTQPNGQTANPRVILERLFLLSPEEQAFVKVIREDVMRADGTSILPPMTAKVSTSKMAPVPAH